jgi:hypothetical protein
MEEYKLVLIRWVDSYTFSTRWEFIEDIGELELMECVSVGFVVKENDTGIMIIPHISGKNEGGMGGLTIPKVSIIEIIELKIESE